MNLITSYNKTRADGTSEELIFPVESESKVLALSRFSIEAQKAAEAGKPTFALWGRHHPVQDFVKTVSRDEFEGLVRATPSYEKSPVAFTTPLSSSLDKVVSTFSQWPKFVTVEEWLDSQKFERRALRWMATGADYVYLLDELWDRDILLPGVPTREGMQVSEDGGSTSLELRRDWEYWVEYNGDELKVTAGPYVMRIVEDETGYAVCHIAPVQTGFVVTQEWIEENSTPAGGWTKHQLAQLGVDWPPQKGWKQRLTGTVITQEQKQAFEG